jgi:lauroyl/myristoyl acyltransferase
MMVLGIHLPSPGIQGYTRLPQVSSPITPVALRKSLLAEAEMMMRGGERVLTESPASWAWRADRFRQ